MRMAATGRANFAAAAGPESIHPAHAARLGMPRSRIHRQELPAVHLLLRRQSRAHHLPWYGTVLKAPFFKHRHLESRNCPHTSGNDIALQSVKLLDGPRRERIE